MVHILFINFTDVLLTKRLKICYNKKWNKKKKMHTYTLTLKGEET